MKKIFGIFMNECGSIATPMIPLFIVILLFCAVSLYYFLGLKGLLGFLILCVAIITVIVIKQHLKNKDSEGR